MTTHISLRLSHPTLNLGGLAAELGVRPTRIWNAGEPRLTPQGDVLQGVQVESYCALRILTPSGTIASAIELLSRALASSENLQSEFFLPDLSKTLYCTLESEGEILDPDALKSLADLGIRLEIAGC